MALSQKEIENMPDIIGTVLDGEFQLDEKQCDLIAKVTVGDLIIHCGLNINQVSDFFNQFEIYKRKKKNFGFHYTKDSALKESKKSSVDIRKIRKLIKEECECQGLSMHIADPYQPTKNQHGGLDFEDHGVGEQVGMIRSNLHSIFTKANGMYEMIGENDRLPEWLQEKIAVADHRIGSAYDYLSHEYNALSMNESFSGNQSAGSFVGYLRDPDSGKTHEVFVSQRFYDDDIYTDVRIGHFANFSLDREGLKDFVELLSRAIR